LTLRALADLIVGVFSAGKPKNGQSAHTTRRHIQTEE